jgi:hypothetical protein
LGGTLAAIREAVLDASEPALPRCALYATVAGLMLSLLLAALDQTIVGTAMPRVVSELPGSSTTRG